MLAYSDLSLSAKISRPSRTPLIRTSEATLSELAVSGKLRCPDRLRALDNIDLLFSSQDCYTRYSHSQQISSTEHFSSLTQRSCPQMPQLRAHPQSCLGWNVERSRLLQAGLTAKRPPQHQSSTPQAITRGEARRQHMLKHLNRYFLAFISTSSGSQPLLDQ